MADDIKMKPKCMNGTIQAAVTNRGHLIPCCYCDEDWALKTPQLKRIVEVSKISEHDTIEDILFSKPWLDFEENLRTHFKSNYGDIWEEVNKTGDWNDDLDKKFKEILSSFMKEGSW